MTKTVLLSQLKEFTEIVIKDMLMPVRKQQEDKKVPDPRAPEVYRMRLIKSTDAKKAAPYIIHQVITGKDFMPPGGRQLGRTDIRSIFCVYQDDEQEGSLLLLGVMERVRIELLKQVIIGKQFQLDLEAGMETLIYPEDTAPYYIGEMLSTWKLPGIEREVVLHG